MAPIDFSRFLTHQAQEKYKPFIIHGPGLCGKTRFAKLAVERLTGLAYLDVLDNLNNHSELPRIDLFKPADLRKLLLEFPGPESVVLVDNLDFLLNTWLAADKRAFWDLVDHDLGGVAKTFVFIIQDDPELTGRPMLNTRKESRVLALAEIELV